MNRYHELLHNLEQENRLRTIPADRIGHNIIDLCSNDYMSLGKTDYSDFINEYLVNNTQTLFTSSASRLLSSIQSPYNQLESFLEEAYGKPALLFNSGYHANVGIIQALTIPGTLWLSDKLIHASAIDGLRLSKAECRRWRHNDIEHLRKILEKEYSNFDNIFILCESIYSMDGNIAPLQEIVKLKLEYPNVKLYVDEAHAIGVRGKRGLGICEELNILDEIDILVGTFGKAVASSGAFAIVNSTLKEYLINCARSFIFSTALAPVNALVSLYNLRKLTEMKSERNHLKNISDMFRKGIIEMTGAENPSQSQIIPMMTGSAENAIRISRNMEERGVLALPIRRPTVPPGGERIRFSIHSSLTEEKINEILAIIRDSL